MRILTSAIPSGRLEIGRDSFDPTNLCQPAIFNRLLHAFLNGVGWIDRREPTAVARS